MKRKCFSVFLLMMVLFNVFTTTTVRAADTGSETGTGGELETPVEHDYYSFSYMYSNYLFSKKFSVSDDFPDCDVYHFVSLAPGDSDDLSTLVSKRQVVFYLHKGELDSSKTYEVSEVVYRDGNILDTYTYHLSFKYNPVYDISYLSVDIGSGGTHYATDATSFYGVEATYDDLYKYYTGQANFPDYDINGPGMENEYTYDGSIGYLQGFRLQERLIDSSGEGHTSVDFPFSEVVYKLIWDGTSSSGFNLSQDGVFVEVYNQVCGSASGFLGFGKKQEYSGEKRLISRFPGENLGGSFLQTSINEVCSVDLAQLTDLKTFLGGFSREDVLWFRISVYDPVSKSYKFGGWLKRGYSADDIEKGFTVDENGELHEDPNYKPSMGFDFGEGDSLEEAEQNSKPLNPSSNQDYLKWFSGTLKDMVDSIGSIPDIFSQVFSFLPSAVVLAIGAGIVFIVILRVLGR